MRLIHIPGFHSEKLSDFSLQTSSKIIRNYEVCPKSKCTDFPMYELVA